MFFMEMIFLYQNLQYTLKITNLSKADVNAYKDTNPINIPKPSEEPHLIEQIKLNDLIHDISF